MNRKVIALLVTAGATAVAYSQRRHIIAKLLDLPPVTFPALEDLTSTSVTETTCTEPGLVDTEPAGTTYARCADGNGTLTHLFSSDDDFDLARAKAICGKCGLAATCLAGGGVAPATRYAPFLSRELPRLRGSARPSRVALPRGAGPPGSGRRGVCRHEGRGPGSPA